MVDAARVIDARRHFIETEAPSNSGKIVTTIRPEENTVDDEIVGFGSYRYRTYVLSALTLIYILNFVDRGLLAVVGPELVPEPRSTKFNM